MYNSYYQTTRVNKLMIESSKIDIVAYAKKQMALELMRGIMDDKEIDLDKVVFKIQFAEYDVRENEGMYPNPHTPYKEIQARLRVIPYA
jgi:hypothetical protein